MVFNATFNNISVISWWLVLLVEDTQQPGEHHRPAEMTYVETYSNHGSIYVETYSNLGNNDVETYSNIFMYIVFYSYLCYLRPYQNSFIHL